MKAIFLWVMTGMSLSLMVCQAQIKHTTTKVKIYGSCEMCESKIEKAGTIKKVVEVDWNQDTKMASLTYDSKKTNEAEILKRIALAGYDNEQFLAPDKAYSALPECCQYERENKTLRTKETSKASAENQETPTQQAGAQEQVSPLKALFDNYFVLKEALVKSEGNIASAKAKDLFNIITAVKMQSLSKEEHSVFMQIMKDLTVDAEHIAETKDIEHQREHFSRLSDQIYKLIKVSKQESPVYYQHCPMFNNGKGANWLSKESAIRNPYYGSQMLTCGKTTETIQ